MASDDDLGFSTEGFYDRDRGPEPLHPRDVPIQAVECPNCAGKGRRDHPEDPEGSDICPACEGYGLSLQVLKGQEALVLLLAAFQMYAAAPEYVENEIRYDQLIESMVDLLEQVTPTRPDSPG